MNYSDLEKLFYLESPYSGFPLDLNEEKIDGWHSDHPIFRELIEEIRPQLYLEVGTWLGASAIHAAEIMKAMDLPTPVVCIDTWLGSQEFWENIEKDKRYQDLQLSFGYPTIFYQFLSNVLHRGLEDRILPLPQTSEIAARILLKKEVKVDMVYIDGSHDAGDVYRDLINYWNLLKPGGLLFGDDFDEFWPGLVKDVNDFAQDIGATVEQRTGFWIIRKGDGMTKGEDNDSNYIQNRLNRLVSETLRLQEDLDTMTARAGYFFEKGEELQALLDEKASLPDDLNHVVDDLLKKRNILEKTNRFYFEQLEGVKKYNEQLEGRLVELQKENVSITASNQKLRTEIMRLQEES